MGEVLDKVIYDLAVIYDIQSLYRSSIKVYIYVLETYRMVYYFGSNFVNFAAFIGTASMNQESFATSIDDKLSLRGLEKGALEERLGYIIFGQCYKDLNVLWLEGGIKYNRIPLGVNEEGVNIYYTPHASSSFTDGEKDESYILDKELKDFSDRLNLKLSLTGNTSKNTIFNNKIYGELSHVPNKYKTYIYGQSNSLEESGLEGIKVIKKGFINRNKQ